MLQGAFGGRNLGASHRGRMRKAMEDQIAAGDKAWLAHRPRAITEMRENMSHIVAGAKGAGLHPLFALGGGAGHSVTSGPASPAPPGQSASGSFMRDASQAIAGHFMRIAEMRAAAELQNARNDGQQISNDLAYSYAENMRRARLTRDPSLRAGAQDSPKSLAPAPTHQGIAGRHSTLEPVPVLQEPSVPGRPEKKPGTGIPWQDVNIWKGVTIESPVPADQLFSELEPWIAIVMNPKNRKPIKRLIEKATGTHVPEGKLPGDMLGWIARVMYANYLRQNPVRPIKKMPAPNQFFPYSRGPHR